MEKNESYAFSGSDAGGGRLRHSGAGIASFLLSLASSAMLLAFFLAAGIQAFRIAEQYIDPDTGIPTISQEELSRELLDAMDGTMLLLPLALLATMIAIVTGIVALAAKKRKKGLGIAGLVISGMQVLFFLFGIMLSFAA
jgi:ABC-type dipeptide/oligopeptide/nickel transport system permease component